MSTPEVEEPPGREEFIASLAKFGEERGYECFHLFLLVQIEPQLTAAVLIESMWTSKRVSTPSILTSINCGMSLNPREDTMLSAPRSWHGEKLD